MADRFGKHASATSYYHCLPPASERRGPAEEVMVICPLVVITAVAGLQPAAQSPYHGAQ